MENTTDLDKSSTCQAFTLINLEKSSKFLWLTILQTSSHAYIFKFNKKQKAKSKRHHNVSVSLYHDFQCQVLS